MKTALVIESPNKIHTIEEIFHADKATFLPLLEINNLNDLKIVPTIGHFLDLNLKDGKKGFYLKDNKIVPEFAYSEKKTSNIYNNLIPALSEADTIFIGSDDDREGERIASEVLKLMDDKNINKVNKRIYRIRTSEITKNGFIKSLSNKEIGLRKSVVDASIARLISDLEYGYTVSTWARNTFKKRVQDAKTPAELTEWMKFNIANKDHIKHSSAGRVRSYALEKIGERCDEIKNYVPRNWYTINPIIKSVVFTQTATSFKAADVNNGAIQYKTLEDAKANLVNIGSTFNVDNTSDVKNVTAARAKPLVLSDIASKNLSNGSKTKQLCAQEIFEAGLSTYPRTDDRYVSLDFVNEALPIWEKITLGAPGVKAEKPEEKWINDGSKDAAHECYRTVDIDLDNYNFALKMCAHLAAAVSPDWTQVANQLVNFKDDVLNRNYENIAKQLPQFKNYFLYLKDLNQLYSDLRTGTVRMLTSAPTYLKADVNVSSQKTNSETFKANLSERLTPGYLALTNDTYDGQTLNLSRFQVDEDEMDDADNSNLAEIVNYFKANKLVTAENFNILDGANSILKARTTRKPTLMTNDELVRIMRDNEIGQPSTRDGIIADISDTDDKTSKKGVINLKKSKQGNAFDLTDFGYKQYQLLRTEIPFFVNENNTRQMEQKLKAVEEGKADSNELILAQIAEINNSILAPYNWYNYDSKNEIYVKSVYINSGLICPYCHKRLLSNGVNLFCDNADCPLVKKTKDMWAKDEKMQKAYPNGVEKAFVAKVDDVAETTCPTHKTLMLKNKDGKAYCLICYQTKTKTDYQCPYCAQSVVVWKDAYYCVNACEKTKEYKGWIMKVAQASQEICPTHHFPKFVTKSGKDVCLAEVSVTTPTTYNCPYCAGPVVVKNENYNCVNVCETTKPYKGFILKLAQAGEICKEHNFPKIKGKTQEYCLYDLKNKVQQSQEKHATEKICPICNQNLFEDNYTIFCDNKKCASYPGKAIYDANHEKNWAIFKKNIVPGVFCPKHPQIPMQVSKQGKHYCVVDILLAKIAQKTAKKETNVIS